MTHLELRLYRAHYSRVGMYDVKSVNRLTFRDIIRGPRGLAFLLADRRLYDEGEPLNQCASMLVVQMISHAMHCSRIRRDVHVDIHIEGSRVRVEYNSNYPMDEVLWSGTSMPCMQDESFWDEPLPGVFEPFRKRLTYPILLSSRFEMSTSSVENKIEHLDFLNGKLESVDRNKAMLSGANTSIECELDLELLRGMRPDYRYLMAVFDMANKEYGTSISLVVDESS